MTAPDPDATGIVAAMKMALDESGFGPEDISHLNAHGTGTQANDSTESVGLHKLCGDELGASIPVTSVKGTTGHMLGAAGAVEAIVCVKSIIEGAVPPTAGYREPDPACNVNVVAGKALEAPQNLVLSNSLGFGGHNACLAISPYDELEGC